MGTISKLSETNWSAISKIDDIFVSSISKYSDQDKPSAPPPSGSGYTSFRLYGYDANGAISTQYMMLGDWKLYTGTSQSGTALPDPRLTGATTGGTGNGWDVTAGYEYAGYNGWKAFDSDTGNSTGWWSIGIANGSLNYLQLSSTTGNVDIKSMRVQLNAQWTQLSYFQIYASTGTSFTGEQVLIYSFSRTGTTSAEIHNFDLPTPSSATTAYVSDGLIARYDPAIYASSTLWSDLHSGTTSQDHSIGLVNAIFTTIGSPGFPVVYMDGVGDYLNVNKYAIYGTNDLFYHDTRLTAYTIDMWVRSNGNWTSQGNIYSGTYNQGTRTRMGGGSTSNHQVAIIAGMSTPSNSASVFASNTWYRFVYTMSGNGTNSTWKMYGDNVERQTITSTAYNPDTSIQAQLLFGTYNSTSEFSKHYLADMKIYNKPLTLQQLNQNYNQFGKKYGKLT